MAKIHASHRSVCTREEVQVWATSKHRCFFVMASHFCYFCFVGRAQKALFWLGIVWAREAEEEGLPRLGSHLVACGTVPTNICVAPEDEASFTLGHCNCWATAITPVVEGPRTQTCSQGLSCLAAELASAKSSQAALRTSPSLEAR